MRRIISITQVSVDGVMQAPGGPEEDPSNGFTRGGWAMPFVDDEVQREITEIISGDFDMILGRRTYEIFAGYWPLQGDHPIATAFNRATKYVATRTLDRLEWETSVRIEGGVVDGLRELKRGEGPDIHVWGSSQLLQTLIAAGLIDEYRLWVFPLVLGKGKRLFESEVPPLGLTLVGSRSTPSGTLISTYQSAAPRES